MERAARMETLLPRPSNDTASKVGNICQKMRADGLETHLL